jgi:ABC-2 type transport system permease protein
MSAEVDAPTAPPAANAAATSQTFYWSVRRELWENRSVYLGPLVVAAIGLFALLVGSHRLPQAVRAATLPGATPKAIAGLGLSYDFSAVTTLMTGLLVAVFYSAGALHNERRDRSILFWKSLPVSDLTTVMSKFVVPLIVMPLAVLPIVVATHLLMLAMQTLVLLASGVDPQLLWAHTPLIRIWVTFLYGLFVMSFWYAPIIGWLMLVSGWAKRVPIMWALGVPLGLALFEVVAFKTHNVWSLLIYRLRHAWDLAYTVGGLGKVQITRLDQIDPTVLLGDPGLWLGLAFAAACLAGCVWQRRYRDPI